MSEGSRKKRARSDDVEISRDDEFWYKDGNIVLIAGNIAFRVYQGLLAEQSQVFMDLFVVPQPAGAETMDDCAMVHLSDSPEDLRHLLRALFKNNNFLPGSEDSVDFAVVFALLRLGHKYQMEGVQRRTLALLKNHFTHRFDHWDDPKRVTHLCISGSEVIGVINVARLVNAQSILPSAFYMCCLLGPAVIDGHQREDGTVEYLSTDDLRRCLYARTKLVEANVAIAFRMFAGHVSIGCKDIKTCERALRESRRALRTSYRAVASYHVLQSWKHWIADQDAEVEFCDSCETMLFARDVEERRNIWKTLPSIMGLHNWKAIMDESGVD